jgi:hypothetical protein
MLVSSLYLDEYQTTFACSLFAPSKTKFRPAAPEQAHEVRKSLTSSQEFALATAAPSRASPTTSRDTLKKKRTMTMRKQTAATMNSGSSTRRTAQTQEVLVLDHVHLPWKDARATAEPPAPAVPPRQRLRVASKTETARMPSPSPQMMNNKRPTVVFFALDKGCVPMESDALESEVRALKVVELRAQLKELGEEVKSKATKEELVLKLLQVKREAVGAASKSLADVAEEQKKENQIGEKIDEQEKSVAAGENGGVEHNDDEQKDDGGQKDDGADQNAEKRPADEEGGDGLLGAAPPKRKKKNKTPGQKKRAALKRSLVAELQTVQASYEEAKAKDDLATAMQLRSQIANLEQRIAETDVVPAPPISKKNQLLIVAGLKSELGIVQEEYEDAKRRDSLKEAIDIKVKREENVDLFTF